MGDFTKKQLVRMHFLDPQENHCSLPRRAKCLFVCTLRRVSYEFLMDRSGLSDAHFFMLVLGIGTASSSNSPHGGVRPMLRVSLPGPGLSSPYQRFPLFRFSLDRSRRKERPWQKGSK